MKKRIVLMVILTAFILTQLSAQTKAPEILEMVSVEGESFQMGSTSGNDDEKPIHSVILTSDYWMGKHEITNEEYIQYLNESGVSSNGSQNGKEQIDMDGSYCEIGYSNGSFYLKKGKNKAPVIEVSWWGAIGYCNWLSEKEGLTAAYDSAGNLLDKSGNKTNDIAKVEGYRLPSEAEWEYAARGGNKNKEYTYSGSNNMLEVGWYDANSGGKKHEVAEKKANELGLYDMSGNVWEWCQDWYDDEYYGKSKNNNPVNLDNAAFRVIRGGHWHYNASDCRVANRCGYGPSGSGRGLGFRVARTCFF